MTIQKIDPSNKALQAEITQAVTMKVADEATYTIPFRGRKPVTAMSAKGAEQLYAECVIRNICPEIDLVNAKDAQVGDYWITDTIWRATWRETGQTYEVFARGTEVCTGGIESDPLGVVPRKAMGKSIRNAQLKVVPAVIRESYINHLRGVTGGDVIQDEEYAPTVTPEKPRPNTAPWVKAASKSPDGKMAGDPHTIVYDHAKRIGLDPVSDAKKIHEALGGVTVPNFLDEHTPEEAIVKLDEYVGGTK